MGRGPFGDIKKLSKKNRTVIILNSLIVTKNVKGGLWAFSTSLSAAKISKKIESLTAPKKIKRGTLWSHPVL